MRVAAPHRRGPACGAGRHRGRSPAAHRWRCRAAGRARRRRPGRGAIARPCASPPAPDGRAGFRSESSHDVIPAPACLIAHPRLAALLPHLRLDPGVEPTLRVSVATGELAARWDRAAGEVHGLPEGTPVGSAVIQHEDVARSPTAGVDGIVLPVRSAGCRGPRRGRPPRRAGAGRRPPRRRRLRRHRDVRGVRHPAIVSHRRHRDVEGGGRGRPPQPAPAQTPRSCAARSARGTRRPTCRSTS